MVATLFQQDLSQHALQQARVPLANRPLPPSERDLGVYEAVVVECQSTRTAAEQFDLSQTRIVQIRDRVIEWIATNVPPTPRLTPRQRLQLAADIAQRRIQFFLSEAMEAWQASKGTQTRTREHNDGSTTTYSQESYGDLRYLLALSRLNEHTLKLLGLEQGVARGLERSSDCEQAAGSLDHPVGDCSPSAALAEEPRAAAAGCYDARQASAEPYDDRAERRRAFLAGEGDVSSPVHERLDDPAEGEAAADGASAGRTFSPSVKFPASVGEPSESLSAAPHADGLDVRPAGQRPISRKQRRARRRLLEKLRRKAK